MHQLQRFSKILQLQKASHMIDMSNLTNQFAPITSAFHFPVARFWKTAVLVSPARAAIAASQSDCSIQSREVVLMLVRHTHYLFQVGRARAMESNQELCLKS